MRSASTKRLLCFAVLLALIISLLPAAAFGSDGAELVGDAADAPISDLPDAPSEDAPEVPAVETPAPSDEPEAPSEDAPPAENDEEQSEENNAEAELPEADDEINNDTDADTATDAEADIGADGEEDEPRRKNEPESHAAGTVIDSFVPLSASESLRRLTQNRDESYLFARLNLQKITAVSGGNNITLDKLQWQICDGAVFSSDVVGAAFDYAPVLPADYTLGPAAVLPRVHVEIIESIDFKFSVTYSPSELRCGVPITFTSTHNGSGGDYSYALSSISYTSPKGSVMDELDPTALSHTSANKFEYTFYASGKYTLKFYCNDNSTCPVTAAPRVVLTLNINDPNYPCIEDVADRIIAEAASLPTDYDKVLYYHDWIAARAQYDYSKLVVEGDTAKIVPSNVGKVGPYMNAIGVLCRGRGTCESYHGALELLCRRSGIPCERATGNGHVWSCILLDGEWTQIDLTWNDDTASAPDGLSHFYFGITDDMTLRAHNQHSPVAERPCTSLERNYFIRTASDPKGEIHRYSDPLIAQIEQNIIDGTLDMEIPVTSYHYRIIDVFYPIVAYYLQNYVYPGASITYSYDKTTSTPTQGTLTVSFPYQSVLDDLRSEFDDFTVTVDGVDYPSDVGFIPLSAGESRLMTVTVYNTTDMSDPHAVYPTETLVYVIANNGGRYSAMPLELMTDALKYCGCSIRISGKKGIRMITGVPSAAKAALVSTGIDGYKLLEYGTLAAWDDELNGAPLLYGSPSAKGSFAYKRGFADPVYATSGSFMQYTNVLVDFSMEQCAKELTLRPYMILEAHDGSRDIIYGGAVHRSIGYIALQNKDAFVPGSGSYEYIWSIIRGVYGSAYDADYKG